MSLDELVTRLLVHPQEKFASLRLLTWRHSVTSNMDGGEVYKNKAGAVHIY